MTKHQWLTLLAILLTIAAVPSSFADWRTLKVTVVSTADEPQKPEDKPRHDSPAGPHDDTRGPNPIILDGQIQEVTRDGDAYVFWLIRQKVPIVAWPTTPVREQTGDRLYVAELVPRDVIHISGNLDNENKVIRADRIIRQLHIEHRP